jgi:carboxyl-terminal processing protease
MRQRITLSALLLIVIFLIGIAIGPAARTATTEETVIEDFAEAVTILEQNYVDKIDYDNVTKTAILGMLHTLDPHSHYYDKREFARFRTEQTSQYFGIGATIGPRNGKVYILAPFPETPAYRGGLRYGDQIVAIDGESTEGWPSPQVSARLRGPRGTPVEVRILRAGETEPRTVKLVRDAVSLPSISSAYLVRPGVGYINLQQRGFNTTTDEEMTQSLDRLQTQGMRSLIIDLRNNPGGLLDQAVRMAQRFLHKGQLILTQKSRSNKRNSSKPYHAQTADPNLMPLVILVDRATASASEIVAASIQEHDRGLLVGESTFGKALVQTIIPLPFGAGLTLTTAKYLTPSGRLIQRTYNNRSFYDYYTARYREEGTPRERTPSGPVFRTDAGREVHGEGGIKPDIEVPPSRLTADQNRLQGVIFAFSRDLVAGLIPGLSRYRVTGIEFNHVLQDHEYRVTDDALEAFKKFALQKKDTWNLPAKIIDENREYLRQALRFEVVSAAHGLETAAQALNDLDVQLLKAIESIPKASQLAEKFKTSGREKALLVIGRSLLAKNY